MLAKRHTVVITMEVSQISRDIPPAEWVWSSIVRESETLRDRNAVVIEVLDIKNLGPFMD